MNLRDKRQCNTHLEPKGLDLSNLDPLHRGIWIHENFKRACFKILNLTRENFKTKQLSFSLIAKQTNILQETKSKKARPELFYIQLFLTRPATKLRKFHTLHVMLFFYPSIPRNTYDYESQRSSCWLNVELR